MQGSSLALVRREARASIARGRVAKLTRVGLGALLGVAGLAVGLPAEADIYKQVGPDGVISFSNTPSGKTSGQLYLKERRKLDVQPVMPSDTSPERFTRYDVHIRQAATLYQIPEALVRAVIKVESNFDPRAVSRANARGLMQMIPGTAERMMVTDVFDPRQNIFGGVRYLRVLANLFNGNLELTIAAYNAGENAVMRHGGIPPYEETQAYVVKVLSYYRHYRAIDPLYRQ
ncbi:MAG: lytic transglycosylase domain-containing protein [Polyangiaceae bacterium]|nr:lytic transglycosylase domain-containing protein [Polyangiaceae bacterium]MCW5792605.1 lytic transglycosylase domain-containing protein [Polyangiaceae bacterium]